MHFIRPKSEESQLLKGQRIFDGRIMQPERTKINMQQV
ncbi:hypothetical protein A6A12_2115 [Vibrio anguillarum]|nr:hypothetical protein A6A12_2115 [Vibrio anguillarum]